MAILKVFNHGTQSKQIAYTRKDVPIKKISFSYSVYNPQGVCIQSNLYASMNNPPYYEKNFVVSFPLKDVHGLVSITINSIDLTLMDGTIEHYSRDEIQFGGCYIATCVYGSYDCPEVWTLRRYRDNTLGSSWYGRFFVRVYYAISPTFVKWFGETNWFKKLWRSKLDKMVKRLQERGVEDTPYQDKEW